LQASAAARNRWLLKIATYNITNVRKRLPPARPWLNAANPTSRPHGAEVSRTRNSPAAAIRKAVSRRLWRGQKT